MDLKIYGQYGGSRNGLLWISASFCTNEAENQHLSMPKFSSIRDQFFSGPNSSLLAQSDQAKRGINQAKKSEYASGVRAENLRI